MKNIDQKTTARRGARDDSKGRMQQAISPVRSKRKRPRLTVEEAASILQQRNNTPTFCPGKAITQSGKQYVVSKNQDGSLMKEYIADDGYKPDNEISLETQIKLLHHFLKDIPPSDDSSINTEAIHSEGSWHLKRGHELVIPERYAKSLATNKYNACLPEDNIVVFERLPLEDQELHLRYLLEDSAKELDESHRLDLLRIFVGQKAPQDSDIKKYKKYKEILNDIKEIVKELQNRSSR
jgi:transcriptional regulator of met regulon